MSRSRVLTPQVHGYRLTAGAVLLILNAATYLMLEATVAAAWRDPVYSYSYNYISDLGVPDVSELQGRLINSPLHVLMNGAFILHGVVFIIAAALIWQTIARPELRRTYLALAIMHGIGIGMVGLFPGSAAALENGTAVLHGAGAVLAIGAGNAAGIVAGIDLARRRLPKLGTAFIMLGIAGIAAFGYLLANPGTQIDGIPERISVYTIIASEVLAALALLVSGRRKLLGQQSSA
ncbi:DUF998 domain-containing protein [Promicromonospora sukumoe]|uniref:DUF998 domain-containing protein n=1 Tax=Promicromonospora sukumoe TaxID=88382 RepID=UPI00365F5326